MLKIGEFARICRVSTQTLRYYDTEGVLCADRIDPETGYRYYAPEKLETFRRIQTYKEAGFSLEEIKLLLAADVKSRGSMIEAKRREIQQELRLTEFKLSRLESMIDLKGRFGMQEILEYLKSDFEDDPDVLGCWELCGRLLCPLDGEAPRCTAPIELSDVPAEVVSRLVLRPRGEPWWVFFWSRGVLYRMYPPNGEVIPHPYTLWEEDGIRYMTVRYVTDSCLYRGEDPIWLLYRQTRHAALSDLESRVYVDNVDYPVVTDPAVLGEWQTVALTKDAESFTLKEIPRESVSWWIMGVTFTSRGSCLRHFARRGSTYDGIYPYTLLENGTAHARGLVLNPSLHVAEAYLLREIKGEMYLFIQHKSGDYCYGGKIPPWYVFRRATRQL